MKRPEIAAYVEAVLRDRIAVEEALGAFVIGARLCPGQHARNLTARPAELDEDRRSREPLPQHTIDLLSDPRLAQVCPECGASL